MKIEFINLNEKIITYRLGKSEVKITEKKIKHDKNFQVDNQLQTLDSIVKGHENSHMKALGPYASGIPVYDTIAGPDGKSYAGGGHIKVDLSPIPGNPEATLQKANTILFASMAPGSPSGADNNVAAEALLLAAQAKNEINQKLNYPDNGQVFLEKYKQKNQPEVSSKIDLFA